MSRNDDCVEVSPSTEMHKQADFIVQIGVAFDGLPLLLKVSRGVSITSSVCRSLQVRGPDRLPTNVAENLKVLEKSITQHALKAGVVSNASGIAWYRSNQKVQTLVGNTLLTRIIGVQSVIGKIGESRFPGKSCKCLYF